MENLKESDEELADIEIRKLKFNYRVIENKRKALVKSLNLELKKKQNILSKLQEENRNLLLDLEIAKNRRYEKQSNILESDYEEFLRSRKNVEIYIHTEKERIKKLEERIAQLKKEVTDFETKHSQILNALKVEQNTQQINSGYIKLSNITRNYNDKLKENHAFRSEIRDLKIIKDKNSKVLNYLQLDVKELNKELKYLIDENALAYEQRMEGYSKLSVLKEKNKSEEKRYQLEQEMLSHEIEEHEKLKKFMLQKIDAKKELKQKLNETISKALPNVNNKVYKLDDFDNSLIAMDSVSESTHSLYNKTQQAVLDEIATGEKDNYNLFCYLYQCQNEIEDLKRKISFYQLEIEKLESTENEVKNIKQEALNKVEASYQMNKEKLLTYKKKIENDEILLASIYEKLDILFKILGCDAEAKFEQRLDSELDINSLNVLFYLSCIETKLNNLIAYSYQAKIQNESVLNVRMAPKISLNRTKYSAHAPLSLKKIEFEESAKSLVKNPLDKTIALIDDKQALKHMLGKLATKF